VIIFLFALYRSNNVKIGITTIFIIFADHRCKTNFDLNKVLEGSLEDSIQAMALLEQKEQLEELSESVSS